MPSGHSSSSRSSSSVISVRPRAGGRYGNNRVTCTDINNGEWGKIVYPGGPKLWRRLVMAFAIMALFGAIFVVLGAVFLDSARKIQEDSGISLPVIWCIIGIVCGTLMILCSIFLGKKMISSKWRTNSQPRYNRTRGNCSQNNSCDSYRETFALSSRSRSDTTHSGDTELDLPPPYEPRRSEDGEREETTSSLPPAAVFIISRGDVNLAIPAVIQNSGGGNTSVMSPPPKYNVTGMVEPPVYMENDPIKPPKYEDTFLQFGCQPPLGDDDSGEESQQRTSSGSEDFENLSVRDVLQCNTGVADASGINLQPLNGDATHSLNQVGDITAVESTGDLGCGGSEDTPSSSRLNVDRMTQNIVVEPSQLHSNTAVEGEQG